MGKSIGKKQPMQLAAECGYIVVMKHDTLISSAANPTVKWLRGLALKKNREEEGLFIIEGQRDVEAAIEAGWRVHTVVATGDVPAGIDADKTLHVTPELMSRIVNRDNAQPVIAVMRQAWADPSSLSHGLWLGLEDIRDPGNLGTIIRTADAVSCAGIVLIGQTCDPFAPDVVRATMGSLPRMPLVRLDLNSFVAWRAGYTGRLIGTHLWGAVDYRTVDYTVPDMIMLMGSETAGLSDTLAQLCDQRVKIPMSGQTESLNLAIASAVMLYEARREKL